MRVLRLSIHINYIVHSQSAHLVFQNIFDCLIAGLRTTRLRIPKPSNARLSAAILAMSPSSPNSQLRSLVLV